ncbi:MAG: glycosyltransferase [Campylobacterales bacterium]
MSPLISVILPVYNVEKYLKKCTESIINQTYENIEIVCIDDGSTDSSGAILDELASKEHRMRVVHQKNMGLMGVRTRGIAEAKGDYIAFIDGDDYVAPDMLQTLLETAVKNDAQISVCGFELTDEDGSRLSIITPKNKVLSSTETLKELIYKDYKESALYPLWNKLFKKKLFDDFAPSKNIANLGEDQYMNFVLIDAASKVAFTDKICYSYVQRANSFMKVPKLSHIDDFFGLWREKKAFIGKLNLLQTNKTDVFNAYFESMFDFYGFCCRTDKAKLIPRFNELLGQDDYFCVSNLPLNAKNIIRGIRFLAKRYF